MRQRLGRGKDWALFLCTDAQLSTTWMLEVYALRWGIEVYVKVAKQHLGFLSEQTRSFASHTPSIHLCVVHYLMLMHANLSGDSEYVAEVRTTVKNQLTSSVLLNSFGSSSVPLSAQRLSNRHGRSNKFADSQFMG